MTAFDEIETAARRYADARRELADELHALEEDVAVAKKRHIKAVKRLAETAAERKRALADMVAGAPQLFTRPRTRLLHGVKFGFVKSRGKLQWADAAQVVKLIKKHFAEQADVLIKVTETPIRSALSQLSGADLKRLGVSVIEAGDVVVVESTDSEIDKLVDVLLDDEQTAEQTAELAGAAA